MRIVGWTVLLALLALVFVAPAALYVVAVQDRPLVVDSAPASARDAERARDLLRSIRHSVMEGDGAQKLSLSQKDVNAIAAFAVRALPRADVRVDLSARGMVAMATAKLPPTPLGRFANLRLDVAPSSEGLNVTAVEIGRLRIGGAVAVAAARLGLDLVLGADAGSRVLESIGAVTFRDGGATVAFHVDRTLVADAKVRVKAHAKTLVANVRPVGDPAVVRAYYEHIVSGVQTGAIRPGGSLAAYLRPVMRLAAQRSAGGDAGAENRAALVALAMYCGNLAFENLVGEVRPSALKLHQPRCERVTLAGREDLRLHFLYSAALKIAADSGIAFAIGEFKELLDSAKGGTGFSFTDLAADRAGIRLAELATDPAAAARVQAALASLSGEAEFFPNIAGLPDGLSEAVFRSRYGDVESPAYRAVVDDIDRRIGRSPAYRGS